MDKWERLFNHLNDWALAIAPDERTEPKEKDYRKLVYDTLQTVMDIMIRWDEEEKDGYSKD